MTGEEARQKVIANTARLMGSPVWRWLGDEDKKLTTAGRALALNNPPVAQAYFQALADQFNTARADWKYIVHFYSPFRCLGWHPLWKRALLVPLYGLLWLVIRACNVLEEG